MYQIRDGTRRMERVGALARLSAVVGQHGFAKGFGDEDALRCGDCLCAACRRSMRKALQGTLRMALRKTLRQACYIQIYKIYQVYKIYKI